MKKQAFLAVGSVVTLLLLGLYTTARHAKTTPFINADGRVTRLEQEQQRQYEELTNKIGRLADLVQTGQGGSRTISSAGAPNTVIRYQAYATPQQLEVQQKQIKQDLDTQFESQSVNARWSVESTRVIEQALTAENLKEVGAPPPAASDIQCRSSMCRIQLVYGDSGNASDAGLMLNAALADRMPYTQILSQPRSDGGVDYLIYATREPIPSRP